jgi:hypothetical protein
MDETLDELEAAGVLAEDFPRRPRFTQGAWALLSKEERRAAQRAGGEAMDRVGREKSHALAERVRQLKGAEVRRAVPLLARLWSECALVPLRTASGHALCEIGTPEARAALERLVDDADDLSVTLAIRAIFDAEPRGAFDRLSGYFEPSHLSQAGGAVIAEAVLRTFTPNSLVAGHGGTWTPRWAEPRAPTWFRQDPRWLELCVRLRRDPVLGAPARDAARHADPDPLRRALHEAVAREGPPRISWVTRARGDLAARYARGEHDAVWRELRALGALDGDARVEALAVGRETMARVARNVDLVAQRLAAHGWVALSGALRTPPQPGDDEIMRRIEQTTSGPLPPALRAFWEVVGGVDFVWNYDRGDPPSLGVALEMDQLDPLYVDPPAAVTYVFDEWADQHDGVDPELMDPFDLHLAPDCLHKANISGGPPYGVELPFLGADPIWANEDHVLPLVDYLRLCLAWGGFPGLKPHAERTDVRSFVERMNEEIEPF